VMLDMACGKLWVFSVIENIQCKSLPIYDSFFQNFFQIKIDHQLMTQPIQVEFGLISSKLVSSQSSIVLKQSNLNRYFVFLLSLERVLLIRSGPKTPPKIRHPQGQGASPEFLFTPNLIFV
jgi:hypothetical protein